MYEDKSRKIVINWKELIIKMVILLFVVFVILWIISFINRKNTPKASNLNDNLKLMQTAANEYFVGSKLPVSINGKKKITLREMFDAKLLIEFKDQDKKSCDVNSSFAEATKINDTDFTIKVKLVCNKGTSYVIDKITIAKEDVPVDNENNTSNEQVDNNTSTDTSNTTKPSTNNTKPSASNTKPSTGNASKPSITKPSENTNTSINNQVANCNYGNKEYINYVLTYEIPGVCAVAPTDYNMASYENAVNEVAMVEYQKLIREMSMYSNAVVSSPNFTVVYNKTNTGLIGYQVLFSVRRQNNYALETVYQYYLNKDGSRKVITDKRNLLN